MSTVLNGYETSKKPEPPCDVTTTADGATDKCALDVQLLGGSVNATPSGLTTGGLITEVTLSSATWTKLPTSNLAARNGMGFQNDSLIEIKINFVDGGASLVGWSVKPAGEFFIDVKDTIDIYAKAVSGSPVVVVMEVA